MPSSTRGSAQRHNVVPHFVTMIRSTDMAHHFPYSANVSEINPDLLRHLHEPTDGFRLVVTGCSNGGCLIKSSNDLALQQYLNIRQCHYLLRTDSGYSSVTHPCEAGATHRIYFAKIPRSHLGVGCSQRLFRSASSTSLTSTSMVAFSASIVMTSPS